MGTPHSWCPKQYARTAAFVPELGLPLIDLLAARPGERVLDLGCGDGTLTQRLGASGAKILGIDASPAMVGAARARGIQAEVMDGCAMCFDSAFDAVFTNAALHWMGDVGAVVNGVHRALRDGGRFVGEFGAEGNVATVIDAIADSLRRRGIKAEACNPWTFPPPDAFGRALKDAGFVVRHLERFERPTLLPGDIRDWLETFAACFLDAVAPDERPILIAEVRDRLASQLWRADGRWSADYVRLRFMAIKPLQAR
jgi:trans-aconitate methyltransferase